MRGRAQPRAGYCIFPAFSSLPWLEAGVTVKGVSPEDLVASLGPGAASYAWAHQVHGAKVVVVEETASGAEVGGAPRRLRFGEADALTTSLAGVVLMVSVADCVPVVVVDERKRVIGAAHCGWRGLVKGVLGALITCMAERFGTAPDDCRAGLGPAIGPCCYEVGDDVVEEFRRAGRRAHFREGAGGRHLDLWRSAEEELGAHGVLSENVSTLRFCTACHPDLFHSYRREGGVRGRMWGFIVMRGGKGDCVS